MPLIHETENALIFNIYVQTRSSENQIVGVHDNAFKIRLKAPPVDGAANKMLAVFLAKTLKIPKSSLEIVTGLTGRRKTIQINIPDKTARHKVLDKLLSI